jgi:hypothetical protein
MRTDIFQPGTAHQSYACGAVPPAPTRPGFGSFRFGLDAVPCLLSNFHVRPRESVGPFSAVAMNFSLHTSAVRVLCQRGHQPDRSPFGKISRSDVLIFVDFTGVTFVVLNTKFKLVSFCTLRFAVFV